MGRYASLVALIVLATGCQSTAAAVPTPVPSPTPHTPVASAVLQTGDVPSDLSPCPSAAPIASYASALQAVDPTLSQKVTQWWQDLQKLGAQAAAISLFAADPAACNEQLAASSNIRSAASFVAVFADEGEANRAWEAGIMGFTPPPPGEVLPGLARGAATGLGLNSWTYVQPPVQLSCWQHSVFVSLVVVANLDAATFKATTAAVDARLD